MMSDLKGRLTNRRSWITLATLAIASVLLVAGCGDNDSGSTDQQASTEEPSGDLEMVVLPSLRPNFKPVIEDYEKSHPDVDVTLSQGSEDPNEYVTQLATQRLGGQAPDLFINLDILNDKFADANYAEDLVPYLERGDGLTREDFAAPFIDAYAPLNEPDAITALPVAADATVVFYNKDLFKKAGVPLPSDEWTYDEFIDTAQQISEAGDGKFWGLAPLPDGDPSGSIWQAQYNPMIATMGGDVYDEETNTTGIGQPEAIEAWELLLEPWQSGAIPDYSLISGASPPTFSGGQYAMEVSVRALIPLYKDGLGESWDVVQMPTVDGERPVGGGSYSLSMSQVGDNKETAWDFLNWFYSNDGGIKLLQENYSVVPPTRQGIENGLWRELPPAPENVDAFAAAIDDATLATNLPGKAGPALDDAVVEAVQQVLLKDTPVDQAFEEAQEKVNAVLEQESP